VAAGDTGAALAVVEGLWERSVDYQRLCEQLIGFYRDVMVVKSVKDPSELVPCLPEEMEQYKAQAKAVDMSRILYSLTTLQNTLARMSRTAQRRAELELGLLRLANPALDTSPEALMARIEALERGMRAGIPARAAEPKKAAAPSKQEAPRGEAPTQREIDKTEVRPMAQWKDVLAALAQSNKALYGTLAESAAYVGGDLLLVDAGDGMFARMVRGDSYAKESLRQAVESVTGQKFRLGPYNTEKYKVQDGADKLDSLLDKAQQLGVDVTVKE